MFKHGNLRLAVTINGLNFCIIAVRHCRCWHFYCWCCFHAKNKNGCKKRKRKEEKIWLIKSKCNTYNHHFNTYHLPSWHHKVRSSEKRALLKWAYRKGIKSNETHSGVYVYHAIFLCGCFISIIICNNNL